MKLTWREIELVYKTVLITIFSMGFVLVVLFIVMFKVTSVAEHNIPINKIDHNLQHGRLLDDTMTLDQTPSNPVVE